jgi:hypothetical protein
MKRIDRLDFNEHASEIESREKVLQLVRGQQASLASTFEDLLGDGGPPEETADEMIRAIKEWREMPSTGSLA